MLFWLTNTEGRLSSNVSMSVVPSSFISALADGRDGRTGVEALLRNARTRDDHGFLGLFLRESRRRQAHGHGGRCSEEQSGTQAAGIEIGLVHVEPPWFCRNDDCHQRTLACPLAGSCPPRPVAGVHGIARYVSRIREWMLPGQNGFDIFRPFPRRLCPFCIYFVTRGHDLGVLDPIVVKVNDELVRYGAAGLPISGNSSRGRGPMERKFEFGAARTGKTGSRSATRHQ